VPQAVY